MLTFTEENYLKAIVQATLFEDYTEEVGVNRLATELSVKPATVSDMVRRLKAKKLVNYQRYGKVSLTKEGQHLGMLVIRRHRLWETFLHTKLNFSWDEVHEVAEELEHVHSTKLMDHLDEFLGFPEFDPHGEAIPNREGQIVIPHRMTLSELNSGKAYQVIAVKDESVEFLQYLDKIGLSIGSEIEVVNREEYDELTTIKINGKKQVVSPKLSDNIYVVCGACGRAKCTCDE